MSAGDRVATTLPPGLAFAELLHALPRLGATLVPLNTRLSGAELRWQREDCAARLLVEEPPGGEEADLSLQTHVDPDAPHSVIYTSGTTAQPKAVVLSYGNHLASAIACAWSLGVAPDDRWLCVLPVFHVGGLAILMRSALYGTAAQLEERFDADAVVAELGAGAVTLVSLVPTMLRRLAAAGLTQAPALRAALLGGAPCPPDLLAWAAEQGVPVVASYGMTETASQIAALPAHEAIAALRKPAAAPAHETAPHEAAAAGRPLPGVELRIVLDGEILVAGPMVAAGARDPDGWLHTGDRGRIDADGLLWVEGRLKDVIVSGGENVAAAEVERALLTHPAVTDAAVVGRPDSEWGEVVVAYVVPSGSTQDSGASRSPPGAPGALPAEAYPATATTDAALSRELIEHCRARLAAYKAPRAIRTVSELPRSAAGKLLKRELAEAERLQCPP